MTVTYEYHLWGGVDAYHNMPGGATSRIRIKKLADGVEIANLDKDMNTGVLEAMSSIELQAIVDKLIDGDERVDSMERDRRNATVVPVEAAVNTKLKAVKLKARVGAYVDMTVEV